MLFQPQQEWEAIAGEFTNAPAIYRGYIIPVSAVGPIATLLSAPFGERGTLFGIVETTVSATVQDAVAHYVLGLGSVFVLAVALELLAPSFSGQGNRVQGLKVAAYASTPAWIMGVLNVVPRLAPFSLLGILWMLYLMFAGSPVVMKVPKHQAMAFGAVAAVAAAVVGLAFEVLARAFV
jgi:hypothetical protein